MVKRRTVMFAVLAAVVAIAAGCGSSSGDSSGSGSTPASSTGPVKLTMWWWGDQEAAGMKNFVCLLYTSPSPRDGLLSRMPSSA